MNTTTVCTGTGVFAGVSVKAKNLGIFNVLADITIMASFETLFYASLGGLGALLISFYGKMFLNWLHRKREAK
jgi:hypothetical protein